MIALMAAQFGVDAASRESSWLIVDFMSSQPALVLANSSSLIASPLSGSGTPDFASLSVKIVLLVPEVK